MTAVSAGESLFDLRDVTYRYEDVKALDGISLSIAAGTRVALLGANGSGKSTLLRLLDALYFADQGSIAFRSAPLTQERLNDEAFAFDFRRRVGLVFQSPDVQLFNPTVLDELAFGPLQMRWPKERIRERIAETMELLDITALRDRSPHRLSGGEKKRVAIASVLVLDPEVLLLDEPTAALDPKSQSQVIDLLAGWSGSDRTIITATHDLGVVEDIADHCIIFQSGRVAAERSPGQLVRDEELLRTTGLLHAHRHVHPSGEVHSHPHLHEHHKH